MKSIRIRLSIVSAMAMCLATAGAHADAVTPDQVKFEDMQVMASLTGTPGNAEEGKKWFVTRKLGNCLACHANQDMADQLFHGVVGPAVDGAGSRYSAEQLRAILVNAKEVFGKETVMPGFYVVDPAPRVAEKFKGKTILSAQQIEDIVAYLATLKE